MSLSRVAPVVLLVLACFVAMLFRQMMSGLRIPADFFPEDYIQQTTWGTYRPGVYFGMRQRVDDSPSFGLAWSDPDGKKIRHNCDGSITKFGWLEHDGRGYGKQEIQDDELRVNMTTSFVATNTGWRFELKGYAAESVRAYLYFADFDATEATTKRILLPTVAELDTKQQVRFLVDDVENGWDAHRYLEKLFRQKKKIRWGKTDEYNVNWFMWEIELRGSFEATVTFGDAPTFAGRSQAFWEKFARTFPGISSKDQPVLAAGFSNMIGGIGYFTGSLVKEDSDHKFDTLFTGTPSRSFFPRGFLWDEGFHSLLFFRWDHWLFMDIVFHWLGLQDSTGWIPRECAIGDESQSRVPEEFLMQTREEANPPSLLLAINDLLEEKPPAKHPEVLTFITVILPALAKWFDYLADSQKSDTPKCYRWSRNQQHCLGSGLDDYPRGLLVDEAECHLDLQVWMTFFAASLHRICQEIPDAADCSRSWHSMAKTMEKTMHSVLKTPNGLQDFIGKQPVKNGQPITVPPWREDGRCGSEFPGECRVGQCCSPSGWCGEGPDFCRCKECGRKMKPLEERGGKWANLESVHSPHLGYVSLFPLIFGLVSEGPEFDRLIALVDKLKSAAGIMSLSREDLLFGKGENYWRGKVWGNLNFLTLQAIFPRHQDLAQAFVSTVIQGYRKSNYFMENFEPSGRGTGARPFTGWTATAAILLATNMSTSSNIPRLLAKKRSEL